MKEINEYEKDLASIRTMMERSVKFISLSGLSGVLAGLYALAGAYYSYKVIYGPLPPWGYPTSILDHPSKIFQLEVIALLVFTAAVITGLLFSWFKSNKMGTSLWGTTSKQLLIDLMIPLSVGAVVIFVMLMRGYYSLTAPLCLIFYGLALIQSSRNTFREIKFLGAIEILLGIIGAIMPGYGLILWATGFGVMHIIYGAIMYFRYDR